ncbi:hypothetical protein J6590_018207 [Homalodisca vitripennis]|nr:hypothetical protein J6590_018207 [Homalodisca vitripennis]
MRATARAGTNTGRALSSRRIYAVWLPCLPHIRIVSHVEIFGQGALGETAKTCRRRPHDSHCILRLGAGLLHKELQMGHVPANTLKEKDERLPLVAWELYFCVLLQDKDLSVSRFTNVCSCDVTDKELQMGHVPANTLKEKDERLPLVAWELYFCVLLQDKDLSVSRCTNVCPCDVTDKELQMGYVPANTLKYKDERLPLVAWELYFCVLLQDKDLSVSRCTNVCPCDVTDKELQMGHVPANTLKDKDERLPLVAWEPYFCVLLQDEQTLTAYRSEELSIFPGTPNGLRANVKIGDALFVELPRVRLDGGAKAFRQRWGYEGAAPPPLLEEDEEGEADTEAETVSLREDIMPTCHSPLERIPRIEAIQVEWDVKQAYASFWEISRNET